MKSLKSRRDSVPMLHDECAYRFWFGLKLGRPAYLTFQIAGKMIPFEDRGERFSVEICR